jgi:hypothetical protein
MILGAIPGIGAFADRILFIVCEGGPQKEKSCDKRKTDSSHHSARPTRLDGIRARSGYQRI